MKLGARGRSGYGGRGGPGGRRRHDNMEEVISNYTPPQPPPQHTQVTNVPQFPPQSSGSQQHAPITQIGSDPSSAASCSTTKKVRGSYKGLTVEEKTKNGEKLTVVMAEDIDRGVTKEARDFANYCGLVLRTTAKVSEGGWKNIRAKHGETMYLKVKDKFKLGGSRRELDFQKYVINTLQKSFNTWKTTLHDTYKKFETDEERLANKPVSVDMEEWKWLIDRYGSAQFKTRSLTNQVNRSKQETLHKCGPQSFAEVKESTRDPITGEYATPDVVWELQHTRKNKEGETLWSDPKSQEIHGRLKELVDQQELEPIENRMNSGQMLTSVLGEKSGYLRGQGIGAKPPRKRGLSQIDVDAQVSEIEKKMEVKMKETVEEKLKEQKIEIERTVQEMVNEKVAEILATLVKQGQLRTDGTFSSGEQSQGEN